jgi:mannitol/fructose-specific phosphotransferase system IIA component (Ntr-type)
MRLASVFSPDCIEIIQGKTTKKGVVEQLLRSLVNARLLTLTQVPELAKALMEREDHGTTALGKGLAMPHIRTLGVSRFVGAIGLANGGIDFRSLDGEPTKLIFLVLGPYDQRERHFELLGRLSALMRDKSVRMFLQGRRTPREVAEYLKDIDARAAEDICDRAGLGAAGSITGYGAAAIPSSH